MASPALNSSDERAVNRFVLLYALAWAGGVIAYTPFLTVLLPMKVAGLAGQDAGLAWLAWLAFVGAVGASAGGIVFGWLSDLTRTRRGWICGGLVCSSLLLLLMGRVGSLAGLIGLIIGWQLSLNMMLGPLSAMAADIIPDRSKGLLGGLQAFAPGCGALAGVIVTRPELGGGELRLELVAGMVVVCVLPLLLMKAPVLAAEEAVADPSEPMHTRQGRAARMWFARLFVQVAEATLFAYMFFWLSGLDASLGDHQIARLFSYVMVISAPLALVAGHWSDRQDRPIAPLRLSAGISALGLVAMAFAENATAAMVAYGLFGVASAVFLALHSAQTLRILPRPHRRGRDLGLFNLANTAPSLIMPWLAMVLVPKHGFAPLFIFLAGLAAAAIWLLAPNAITKQD